MNAQPEAGIEPRDPQQRAGDTHVTEQTAGASPRFQARMAGVIALITTTSGFTAIVVGSFVVSGDAAATAHNILAHEMVFRLAVAGDVIAQLYIAYTLLLYNLFRPVNRSLSLLAAFFSLVGTAIGAVNSLLLLGSYNLLIGYLIVRSTFLPRILGVLLAISGVCYLINSFANFLSPAFAAHLLPYILIPGGADLLVPLWLLVVGVNVQRWKEQASAAGASLHT